MKMENVCPLCQISANICITAPAKTPVIPPSLPKLETLDVPA